jgi:hypothetical protein
MGTLRMSSWSQASSTTAVCRRRAFTLLSLFRTRGLSRASSETPSRARHRASLDHKR